MAVMLPRKFGQVNQTISATEIHECAEIDHVLHRAAKFHALVQIFQLQNTLAEDRQRQILARIAAGTQQRIDDVAQRRFTGLELGRQVALAEEGLQLVRTHCSAASHANSPLERVREAFWRFYTFSKEQPEYFSLIFVDSAVPRISRDWERFSSMRDLRQEIEQDIQQCIDDGVFQGVEAPGAVFRILWTAAYGVAVFRLSHRLAPGEDSDALAQDLLDVAIAGLQHGIELRFTAASDTREPLEAGESYTDMQSGA